MPKTSNFSTFVDYLGSSHDTFSLTGSPRGNWRNYSEIHRNRIQWLESLKPHSDPDSYINNHINSQTTALYEAVVVFRLKDVTVSCVMLDNEEFGEDRWPLPPPIARAHKRHTVLKAFDGEQRSLTSNSLIASDLEMHKLKENLISLDITQYYTFDNIPVGEFKLLKLLFLIYLLSCDYLFIVCN